METVYAMHNCVRFKRDILNIVFKDFTMVLNFVIMLLRHLKLNEYPITLIVGCSIMDFRK